MKKLFFSIMALGAILLTGCQEEIGPVMQGGNVTFTLQTPDVATKTIGDGENVDIVYYEIYLNKADHKNNLNGKPLVDRTVPMDGKAATLSLNLLEDQEYVALFWAQVDKDAEGNKNAYYDVSDLRRVKVNYPEVDGVKTVAANDESRAAFYKKYEFNTENPQEYKVTLVRPFAQLNLGTTQESLSIDYQKELEESQVAVSGVATEFNVAEEKAVKASEEVLYAYAAVPTESLTVNEVTYAYAGMNYFLVPEDEGTVNIVYDIKTDVGTVNRAVPSVPVKKNYRTNIIGNLLTKETVIEIVVDEDFAQPDYVLAEEWAQTGNYTYEIYEGASATALEEVLKHADAAAEAATKSEGPVVTINLAGNVEWETGAQIGSTPLLDEESLISEVIINGNGKTFTATGAGVGKIRLANGGKLVMKNLKVVDLSESYAENSWEYGYLEFGGVIRLEECEVVNAIMFSGETAAFKSCIFNSNKDNEYAVWVDNGSAYFTDCTFTGPRGLKMHEDYGSEVVKVSVDGCTFGPLTVKPGIAIGTVNAETSVIIKNSLFKDCQAGDQGLYMYETDTDVETFTFVTEKNTVVPSGDEVIEQGDGVVMVATAAGFVKAIEEAEAGDVIKVAGSVVLPTAVITKTAGALTIEGYTEDAEVAFSSTPGGADGGLNCYADGMELLFKNITVVSPNTGSAYSGGFGRAKSVTFENCEYIGQYRAVSAYTKFIECTIDPQTSYIYTDYANVDFTGCTFNCSEGKGVQVYNDGNTTKTVINVTDCTFSAAKHGATWDGKPVTAIDINSNGEVFAVNITNTTATGFPEGLATASTLFNIKGGAEYVTVIVEGNKYVAEGLLENENGDQIAYSEAGLKEALENGGTVVLANPFTIDQSETNGYGKTGINMNNGGTLDGNGNELGAPGSTGTWDSAINTSGGTIKNLKVTKGFRGIFIKKDSKHNEKLYLDNVTIDGTTYTISCDSGNGLGLEATNSTFKGWTSYAATLGDAKFIDCSFGEGNGYSYCRPYAPTEFVGCAFESGFEMDARAAVTFENCTLDGVALTAENIATLVTSNTANATIR